MSMMMDELMPSKHHLSTLQERIRDKEQELKALKKRQINLTTGRKYLPKKLKIGWPL